jgi:hypothetical protein
MARPSPGHFLFRLKRVKGSRVPRNTEEPAGGLTLMTLASRSTYSLSVSIRSMSGLGRLAAGSAPCERSPPPTPARGRGWEAELVGLRGLE